MIMIPSNNNANLIFSCPLKSPPALLPDPPPIFQSGDPQPGVDNACATATTWYCSLKARYLVPVGSAGETRDERSRLMSGGRSGEAKFRISARCNFHQ